MKEKEIVKEIFTKEKPVYKKSKRYKTRKEKGNEQKEFKVLDDKFFIKLNELPNMKISKQVGYYKIGKSFHVFFEVRPNAIHRYFTKLFLGWKWHDQK